METQIKTTGSKLHTFMTSGYEIPALKTKLEQNPSAKKFPNGISYQEFTITTELRQNIVVNHSKVEGLYFIFCKKGCLSINSNGSKESVLPFQSALIFKENATNLILNLKEKTNNEFCVIGLVKSNVDKSSSENLFYNRVKDTFLNQVPKSLNIYIGPPYLELLENIDSVCKMSKNDAASELIMHGQILKILGLKMQQVQESISLEGKEYDFFSELEMERLYEVSEYIFENPGLDYSVESICRRTGLSPAKLQEGFKKIHDRTLIDFIRNVRLEKSLEMIKTTDMNISEIVYSIGLTSRSYFSKIFKNKYKFSPKVFKERYRTMV